MRPYVRKLVAGLAVYVVLIGSAYAQTIVSSTSVTSTPNGPCSGGVCAPVKKVPEIDASSGALGLALAVVAMLLSAELFRRRS